MPGKKKVNSAIDKGPLSDFRQSLSDLSGGSVRLTDVAKVDGNHTRSLAEGTLKDGVENKKALASAVPGDKSPFKATDVTSAQDLNKARCGITRYGDRSLNSNVRIWF